MNKLPEILSNMRMLLSFKCILLKRMTQTNIKSKRKRSRSTSLQITIEFRID